MWDLKNGTDEPIRKAEIDRHREQTPSGERGGGMMNWEPGIDIYIYILSILRIKQIDFPVAQW